VNGNVAATLQTLGLLTKECLAEIGIGQDKLNRLTNQYGLRPAGQPNQRNYYDRENVRRSLFRQARGETVGMFDTPPELLGVSNGEETWKR